MIPPRFVPLGQSLGRDSKSMPVAADRKATVWSSLLHAACVPRFRNSGNVEKTIVVSTVEIIRLFKRSAENRCSSRRTGKAKDQKRSEAMVALTVLRCLCTFGHSSYPKVVAPLRLRARKNFPTRKSPKLPHPTIAPLCFSLARSVLLESKQETYFK